MTEIEIKNRLFIEGTDFSIDMKNEVNLSIIMKSTSLTTLILKLMNPNKRIYLKDHVGKNSYILTGFNNTSESLQFEVCKR